MEEHLKVFFSFLFLNVHRGQPKSDFIGKRKGLWTTRITYTTVLRNKASHMF